MAIIYNMHENPQPKSRKGKKQMHARAISTGTMNMAGICKRVCARASISSADVKAVLDSFVWIIGLALENGEHVELEDLGNFSPALRTLTKKGGEYTVVTDGVNFRCSEELKNKMFRVELKKEAVRSGYEASERKKRMLQYLEDYHNISATGYAELNACSRYTATAELKQFMDEGLIFRIGGGTHTAYLLSAGTTE